MRKRIAIGMILRSDDTVASGGTLSTMLTLGRVCEAMGILPDFFPLMGAGKDLARAEVLAAFREHSKAEDLLWLDFGNALPPGTDASMLTLQVLLTSERPALYLPYLTRGGRSPSYTASLPGSAPAGAYVEAEQLGELGALRLLKLGGCGFGGVRMTRAFVEQLYKAYGSAEEGRAFTSEQTDFGELACIDVFSSTLARRPHDRERADRPVRLLPEDDSFWHRAREVDVHPYALVDFPMIHGRLIPGVDGPSFARWIGLPEARAQSESEVVLS